jgi:hypothetical protein
VLDLRRVWTRRYHAQLREQRLGFLVAQDGSSFKNERAFTSYPAKGGALTSAARRGGPLTAAFEVETRAYVAPAGAGVGCHVGGAWGPPSVGTSEG